MSIVFVDQSGQLGGAELCLADIARAFRGQGRVVLLADGPFVGQLQSDGVEVSVCELPPLLSKLGKKLALPSLPFAGLAALGYLRRLRRAMRGASIVYFNTPKALLLGSLAATFRPAARVFHLHDLLIPEHFSKTNIRLLVAAANRCRCVIANSQSTADTFRRAGGRAHTVVIPNGFDLEAFDRIPPSEPARLRAEIAPGAELLVGIFGRLSAWKGQHVLLEAAKSCPGVHVVVVGEALFTAEDRRYAEDLKRSATDAALQGRVSFLGFRTDIPELMRAMDVIAHCSTAPEPFGRVVVEGMLAGKPVIASRAGGPAEIIEHQRTGLLVPPNDAAALAKTLQVLAASALLRSALGESGYVAACNSYALPKILQRTNSVIKQLITAT